MRGLDCQPRGENASATTASRSRFQHLQLDQDRPQFNQELLSGFDFFHFLRVLNPVLRKLPTRACLIPRIARDVGQLPMYYNRKPSSRRGYIDNTTTPLFPFGFGLSYTRFEISAPVLQASRIGTNGSTRASVQVRNVGNRRGDEVVQLYIRDDVSSVTRPLLELKGFQRVTLEPGETRTVTFDIKPTDLWFYNADMKRVVEPGTFTIFAGPNSVDLKKATLTVA